MDTYGDAAPGGGLVAENVHTLLDEPTRVDGDSDDMSTNGRGSVRLGRGRLSTASDPSNCDIETLVSKTHLRAGTPIAAYATCLYEIPWLISRTVVPPRGLAIPRRPMRASPPASSIRLSLTG